jgi:putative spermidine/putrescine transport system permease protein
MTLHAWHPFRLALAVIAIVGYVFLLAPIVVIAGASFGPTQFLVFPPQGFSLRWYEEALARADFRSGFQISLIIAAVATVLSTVIGALAAVAVVRFRFVGRDLVIALFLSPLILPSLVLAVGLLLMFSGARIDPSPERLIAAHLVVCVPYVIRTLVPVLQRFDRSLEEAAQNLGASPLAAFWLVTLPVIRPGLVAGAFFAFIISFDEVVLGIFLAPARQPTLPIQIYSAVQFGLDPTVAAISTLLIVLTLVLVVVSETLLGIRRLA